MFSHVRDALEAGEVVLDKADLTGPGDDRPLVKDKYGSERRKAKTLNFSIAYGKTAHGLAKDWGVSQPEAQAMLELWYADRPEVRAWQERQHATALETGYTTTLMGRRRRLKSFGGARLSMKDRGSVLRQAINTPVQGGAADVVMLAMIKLAEDARLRALGWDLLLQVHDEVMLEGPEESAADALEIVKECMENPFDGFGLKPLRVQLEVDAKSAKTWFQAK